MRATRRARHAEQLSTALIHSHSALDRHVRAHVIHMGSGSNYACVIRYPQHVHSMIHTCVWDSAGRVLTFRSAPKVREHDRGLTPESCEETRLP